MSEKQIAKSIKAAGLQKLRYYCEMCGKQCRDENGFQNHLRSENHARQMAIFLENSASILDEKSDLFEKAYMDVLRRHGTIRHNANQLYQEILSDRAHVRLNSTKWASFSDFIQYLGQTGRAEVDYEEGTGWFVQYTFKDAAALDREKKVAAHKKLMEQTEILNRLSLEKQLEAARAADLASPDYELRKKALAPSAVNASQRTQKLAISLSSSASAVPGSTTMGHMNVPSATTSGSFSSLLEDENEENDVHDDKSNHTDSTNDVSNVKRSLPVANHGESTNLSSASPPKRHAGAISAVDTKPTLMSSPGELPLPHTNILAKNGSVKIPWVRPELVVKVLNKTLREGAFYKKKGEIVRIYAPEKPAVTSEAIPTKPLNPTLTELDLTNEERLLSKVKVAEVKVYGVSSSASPEIVRLPLSELETVIPSLEREVAIVAGPYCFSSLKLSLGKLVAVDFDRSVAVVKLTDKRYGQDRGKEIQCSFDDICKTVYS